MWIAMLLLLGMAIFIVWDSRRLKDIAVKPLTRHQMKKGYLPRGLIVWHFWLGTSVVTGLVAFGEWQIPSLPPYTGRWSWISQMAYATFGGRGVFLLVFGIAACAFVAGIAGWHRDRSVKLQDL